MRTSIAMFYNRHLLPLVRGQMLGASGLAYVLAAVIFGLGLHDLAKLLIAATGYVKHLVN